MNSNNRSNQCREEMNNKLNDIMSLIQQNPKLSYIKPEILEKINEN